MTTTYKEILPPPTERYTVLGWLHKNLFRSIPDTILTILSIGFLYLVGKPVITWIFTQAKWEVVSANLNLIMVGRYPIEQIWRIFASLGIIGLMIGLSWGIWIRAKWMENLVVFGFPFALAILASDASGRIGWAGMGVVTLIGFGLGRKFSKPIKRFIVYLWNVAVLLLAALISGIPAFPALPVVDSMMWGGLLLTFILSGFSLVVSFPIGVFLALGRQSKSPLISTFCILYIELVRSVPLVTILFTAQILLPMFLPEGVTIDRAFRALFAITFFSAAYMAEIVRGGLQAIPRGQYEAAQAIGLNTFKMMRFIILPQALRLVIPVIVAHCISTFRDTSLVIIVGLLDLLGIAKTILAQPVYLGTHVEVYSFIAALYWVFCFVMSYLGQRIEVKTGVKAAH